MRQLNVTPVILCGGSGTRLWPLSRKGFPKQFLVLSGKTSLFQQAIARLTNLDSSDIDVGESLVVTNEEHRFLVVDQLRELPKVSATLILESEGRNTAPALTLAALQASVNGDDPILVVTPADQTVNDSEAFTLSLQGAIRVAATGAIVILGIAPDKPETGFGYIRKQGGPGSHQEFFVAEFVEKPDADTALSYLESGDYSWNSGMFVVRASVWLRALNKFRPDILNATTLSFTGRTQDNQFVRPNLDLFNNIPSESIDYGVMEKCPGSSFPIKMISLDVGWDDLGAWDAVWQVGEQDGNGNVLKGDIVMSDTTNSFVYADSRLVGVVGIDNLIVIETADAVLVVSKSKSQQVRQLVSMLEANERSEHILSRKVYRPWGWYDSIDEGEHFKVKRIQVKPGASLSLQKHAHRSEHWVVVKGVAQVMCGKSSMTLHKNDSTFIPQGEVHRLSNFGDVPLEIIEVQSGEYLGEDDIVRFEDNYGR